MDFLIPHSNDSIDAYFVFHVSIALLFCSNLSLLLLFVSFGNSIRTVRVNDVRWITAMR